MDCEKFKLADTAKKLPFIFEKDNLKVSASSEFGKDPEFTSSYITNNKYYALPHEYLNVIFNEYSLFLV